MKFVAAMRFRLFLVLMLPLSLHAQVGPQASDVLPTPDEPLDTPRQEHLKRVKPDKELVKGIGFLPGRMHRIEGLSLSIWTSRTLRQPLVVKGVNMDFQPLGALFVMLMILYQPFTVVLNDGGSSDNEIILHPVPTLDDTLVQIRGLDLRVAGCVPHSALYGLGLSGAGSTYTVQHGTAVSLAMNMTTELHGLQLALWGNLTRAGKGIQIGLFNRAEGCDCLQFGLLNRNGRRLLPFVNWARRRDVQAAERRARALQTGKPD